MTGPIAILLIVLAVEISIREGLTPFKALGGAASGNLKLR